MRIHHHLKLAVIVSLFTVCSSIAYSAPFEYPQAPHDGTTEDHFGIKVADPYRPLEEMDSPQTKAWVNEENKLTFNYLDTIPERKAIKDHLKKVWNFDKYSLPVKKGSTYFFLKKSGLQNQAILYKANSLAGNPEVLLDPNPLSPDGTATLSDFSVSEDGKYLAYAISYAGSDWQEWRVREVASAKDTSDLLEWSKFGNVTWSKDSSGFYYARYIVHSKPGEPPLIKDQKIYFHKIGDPQTQDRLVLEQPEHDDLFYSTTFLEDERTLLISVTKGIDERNLVWLKDTKTGNLHELVSEFKAEFSELGDDHQYIYFKTTLNAPLGRIVAMDPNKPSDLKEIVPEQKEKLERASLIGGKIFVSYLKDAQSQVKVYSTNGKELQTVELPTTGTAEGFGSDTGDDETFYSIENFFTPQSVYRYDLAAGKSSLWKQPELPFKPSDFETTQIFYKSKDGTSVPMFITHRKGIQPDGTTPTLLYGYGGFKISITPTFSPEFFVWLDGGGVLAVANLRGGGEYGDDWHKAGMLHNKQNVFDDFISAGEYLIQNHWTSREHLAISGRSNGGLLVGATLVQRPDLFGAALPGVGVLDMLRFQKFTVGGAWQVEYGYPDQNAEDCKYVLTYSPLHNVKRAKYPATMVYTADHDDRVVPLHSYKFAATLQQSQLGDAPILLRVDTNAGHGAGMPTEKIIDAAGDRIGFLVKALGAKMKF